MKSLSWPRVFGPGFQIAGMMAQLRRNRVSEVNKGPVIDVKEMGGGGENSLWFLLGDFAYCESGSNGVNFNLHVVARFGLWDEDYEAFDSCYSVTATASLFDVKLVLFAFLNWLVEGMFHAHSFHLIQFVQLVFREKT